MPMTVAPAIAVPIDNLAVIPTAVAEEVPTAEPAPSATVDVELPTPEAVASPFAAPTDAVCAAAVPAAVETPVAVPTP